MIEKTPDKQHELRVGIVQMCSTEDIEENLTTMIRLGRKASEQGARWILYPENCLWLSADSNKMAPTLYPDSEPLSHLKALAKEANAWLLLGSVAEKSPEPQRVFNTSVLISPLGDVQAHYRKCFLFDVDITGRETHRESSRVAPGQELITSQVAGQTAGLSICYDLRFPEMYRELTQKGATILTVPAAFTSTTGRDHWEVLLRARAIENQCFVVAPNQWGHHGGKRRSYGRSLVVSPWGVILAQVPDGEGIAVASLNIAKLLEIRMQLPCLSHRRPELFNEETRGPRPRSQEK